MCGIIGYWGPKVPKDVILEGLKKLEYRGYDSAGVAVIDGHNGLKLVRSPGKLSRLEETLKGINFEGRMGIGHTRWATHGAPTEANAHPHKVGPVAIVHNGIIENYLSIRERLKAEGADIKSETDSELIAHLINKELKKNDGLLQATLRVIGQLKGAYSILVANEKEPDTIVAFKNGTPMLVGLGADEVFIASDVQALIAHTNRVVYMEDGEIAVTNKSKVDFYSAQGRKINKPVKQILWTSEMAQKGGFEHFMQKEIFEQPRAVIHTMEPHIKRSPDRVELKDLGLSDAELRGITKIHLVACGTSSFAALYGEYLLEKIAKIPCEVDLASEFRYREPILTPDTLVLVISQSGETADTLAAVRQAAKLGAKVMAICNVRDSSIDREANARIYTLAGPEIGVASTKAFTAQMTALALFTLHAARVRGAASVDEIAGYVRDLLALPGKIEICLNHDKWFAQAATTLKSYKGFLYIGRGVNYPIALEGALKLKEISYLHAEGYAAGELKHGPIALVDDKMAVVVLAPQDSVYEKTLSNLQEVKARGGHIISIGTEGDKELAEMSLHFLGIPRASWIVNPILAAIPVQLLSYHVAVSLGCDVDQPRNLAKSVTVE